jgi:hypothetical protein
MLIKWLFNKVLMRGLFGGSLVGEALDDEARL